MLLQSPMPRYKIIGKMKKQFIGENCGMPFFIEGKKFDSCIHYIAQEVINELSK